MGKFMKLLPGLAVTALLGWLAMVVQNLPFMQKLHFSSLIIAILLGIVINNLVKMPAILAQGIRFASKKILRLAIILLGFKLSLTQILQVGGKGLIVVVLTTTATMFFAAWIGKRLHLEEKIALLIGAGTAICGASAIAAVAPVVDAEEKDTTFAIAAITLFGTVSMFIYPLLFKLLHLSDVFYSIWAGSTIHEVAQVVAAGFAVNDQVGQFATLVKLARVLLVIPIAVLLGLRQAKRKGVQSQNWREVAIPWFVFGFLAMVCINSLQILPGGLHSGLVSLDGFLLTWSMAGLGLETSLEKMKKVGLRPFYAGFVTTIFIAVFGYLIASVIYWI